MKNYWYKIAEYGGKIFHTAGDSKFTKSKKTKISISLR